jgi:hypothetical protein
MLVATYPPIEERSLLGTEPPQDPGARLEIVAEDQTRRILTYEPEMRAVLRLSVQGVRPPELPMHRGLRISWIELDRGGPEPASRPVGAERVETSGVWNRRHAWHRGILLERPRPTCLRGDTTQLVGADLNQQLSGTRPRGIVGK